jgi:hypothetical protein
VLGLFLYLLPGAFSLGADDNFFFSADAGPLLVMDEGVALYWRSGLSFKRGERFFADMALGQVISSLPWVEGTLFGGLGSFGLNMPRFGLDIGLGFLQHGLLSSTTEAFSMNNEGGRLFFAGIKAPAYFGEWTVAPVLGFGSGAWDEGNLYWFFGKPEIPALALYGLSLAYQKKHELAFRHLSMDMNVLNNDAELLFDSRLDGHAAYYRFSLAISSLRLGGSLGALHAAGRIDGSLTASNQHFAYFPYFFWDLDGSFDAYAGFATLDAKQSFSIFQYSVMIGAAHIFQSEGLADIHYRNKTLFGGEEAFDTKSLDLSGLGAAFILLDAGPRSLRLGNRARLSLGLKKLFVVPWGYEQARPGASTSPGESASSAGGLLQTVLLSGLSFYGFLRW